MNIFITLDYELFFGKSGTVDNCLIKPTEKLLEIANEYNVKIVFFVDAGYLIQLENYFNKYSQLKEDYKKVTNQIKYLSKNGHGIELHIHPHWEDSYFDGKQWIFDTNRYKLSDFSSDEVIDIITRYTGILNKITGKNPVAYRAGGWSAQPFKHIKNGLIKNDIFIDSTVYPKGFYSSDNQCFDFRLVNQYNTQYNFTNDLVKEEKKGVFIELPISSLKVSPIFFWKMALVKILKINYNKSFGDGEAITSSKKELIRMLTSFSNTVVSIDGYKASLINRAFKKYKKNTKNKGNFVLIGHPKAFTQYSLDKMKLFIKKNYKNHEFKVFNKMINEYTNN